MRHPDVVLNSREVEIRVTMHASGVTMHLPLSRFDVKNDFVEATALPVKVSDAYKRHLTGPGPQDAGRA